MTIFPLSDVPTALPILAKWHFNEWQFLYPNDTEASFATDLEASICEEVVPSTFVAVDDNGGVAGSISLIEDDMEGFRDYTPWLASLYVDSGRRSQGIGRLLIEHLVSFARSHGLTRLYLYTPDARRYYESLGWKHLEQAIYHGEQVDILTMAL